MRTKSMIERARREQIIAATIEVLAANGGGGTTFVKIATKAKLSSPGLISYHFESRRELLESVLAHVEELRAPIIHAAQKRASSLREALRATLTADMELLGARPQLLAAVVEAFHELRDQQGRLKHLAARGVAYKNLLTLLRRGQRTGEFSRTFDAESLALILDGARTQFLAQLHRRPELDVAAFTATLVQLALLATKQRAR